MKIKRSEILQRGVTCTCPNCGKSSLFRTVFRLHYKCPECGLKLERGEGFFLGSMSLNYIVTTVFFLLPVTVLWYFNVISDFVAVILAVVMSIGVPVLFYRWACSLWLMAYFLALPHELPQNTRPDIPVDEV